jgi:hypothetical protein
VDINRTLTVSNVLDVLWLLLWLVVTAVVVRDWWLRRWRPLRRWLWWVGGSDDAGCYDGGCGGLVTPTVAASRVKTLTDPAVDGDVVFFGGADFSSCNYGGCSN